MSTIVTRGLLGPRLITQGYTSAAFERVVYNILQCDYSRNVLQAEYSREILQADYGRQILQTPKGSD